MACVANKRITAAEWNQDVRHIEFQHPNASLTTPLYQPGDVLNIWPKNDLRQIHEFIHAKYPQFKPETVLSIDPRPAHVPSTVAVERLLQDYLDINGVPSRFFFQQAAFFCSNPEERDKMVEMASSDAENAASYITYCKRERRTYTEVLMDFASCDIPFSYLLQLIPPLRPRAYSISSSPTAHGTRIHVTVALLHYVTPWKRGKTGTCSAYLQTLKEGEASIVFITEGTLRLPKDPAAPLVLIGTGTGCAPMRSLMYERSALRQQQQPTDPRKHITFYFGCRRDDSDYLYREEWPLICDAVHVAFSKQDNKRVPVLLARDEVELYRMLVEEDGYVYISGSAKRMPADVRETFVQIFGRVGELSREDAVKLVRHLEKERRYIVEAWS